MIGKDGTVNVMDENGTLFAELRTWYDHEVCVFDGDQEIDPDDPKLLISARTGSGKPLKGLYRRWCRKVTVKDDIKSFSIIA